MKRKYSLSLTALSLFFTFFLSSCSKKDSPAPTPPSNTMVPVVTTSVATNVAPRTVQTGGTVTSDGGASITDKGICYSISPAPTINDFKLSEGTGSGSFTTIIAGLPFNQAYYIRAYATNSKGTGYGNEIYIVTSATPFLTTEIISVSNNKWMGGGNNISSGASAVTEKGLCWATTPNPTISNNKTTQGPNINNFTSRIILESNATYYVRAYATNGSGTGYGNEVTVTTGIAIGLLHGGGMIFDVDASGQHGLAAALSDLGTAIPWAPGSAFTTITNATSSFNGAANTTTIINVYGNSGTYAARMCRTYTGGGFSDWFLPSNDQLFKLSGYQDIVGGFPTPCFLCTFNYWSSTENNNFRAWDQNLNYGSSFNNAQKNQLNYVRAVRAF